MITSTLLAYLAYAVGEEMRCCSRGVGSPTVVPWQCLLLAVGTCDFLAKRSLWPLECSQPCAGQAESVELKHLEAASYGWVW